MAGVKAYPVSETCRDRAQRIRRNQRCISAFTDCCEFANKLRLEEPNKLLILARMREYESSGCPAPEQGDGKVMESISPLPGTCQGCSRQNFTSLPKLWLYIREEGQESSSLLCSALYSVHPHLEQAE